HAGARSCASGLLPARMPAARRPHPVCRRSTPGGTDAAVGRRKPQIWLTMAQRIVIDPVTRIEGHAKITIQLDDAGNVSDAECHVVECRGCERFCVGRPLGEMAGIPPRLCGICPVSHLLVSAKAGDEILAVKIPIAAEELRRLMNMAPYVQSHALSFFHLSAPDLLLGWDAAPATRNVFGLIAANPDLARAGI